jgi:hypothetical protein
MPGSELYIPRMAISGGKKLLKTLMIATKMTIPKNSANPAKIHPRHIHKPNYPKILNNQL